jgi:CDP-paratose 2-epimerase
MKMVLITGSSGLVGSESVRFFIDKGFHVIGIDNDMRRYFFGDDASTKWQGKLLKKEYDKERFTQYDLDIRENTKIENLFKKYTFDLIIHAAAQPSHDWAAKEPITDFTINANGTLVLLENVRKYCPKAVFIFTSTNKVYGDTPNLLPLVECEKRYEISKTHVQYKDGIDESMSIDNSKHSIFGVSKVAADIMVQEYGKYFGLNTTVFRCGCLTGPGHSGAQLHGFLAYLVRCIATGKKYSIFGYKGKQVRDNIHSYDLANAFWHVFQKPNKGEVYNMGGSRHSNISVLEAIEKIEGILGKKALYEYLDTNRSGDHIWYISNVSKFKKHYPNWKFKYNIDSILAELCGQGHNEST